MIPYGKHNVKLSEALRVAWQIRFHSLTQGSKINEFERLVAKYVGAKYAVAISSATAGLHIAMLALDLPQKSKVITSPISFVASSNSVLYAGHHPLFVDIEPNANGIRIIEDAAHAFGASYEDGQKVGSCSFSDMTVFSFHPVKSITTGEGGMVTTNDYELYKKLIRLRSHGINKLDDEFTNPILSETAGVINPWYYEMIELGFNFRLTEIQAVLGISQLKRLDNFIARRSNLVTRYQNLLKNNSKISPAQKASNVGSANHIFPVRVKFNASALSRNELMNKLKEVGIISQVHYIPIPSQPYYQQLGYSISEIPNAFSYYEEALTIPLFPSLKKREQRKIIKLLEDLV